jgi:hypothetical protein
MSEFECPNNLTVCQTFEVGQEGGLFYDFGQSLPTLLLIIFGIVIIAVLYRAIIYIIKNRKIKIKK